MASQDQFASNWVAFAGTAAGVQRASAPSKSPEPPESNGLARQVPGNGSAGSRQISSAIDRRWVHLCYMLIDIVLIAVNGLLAFYLRLMPLSLSQVLNSKHLGLRADLSPRLYGGYLLLYAILVVVMCRNQDLYRTRRGRSATRESLAVVRAVVFATFLLATVLYCLNVTIISRAVVGVSALLNAVTLVIWRIWKRRFVTRRVSRGIGAVNALIIGTEEVGQALGRYLEQNKQLGYRVTGFLESDHQGHPQSLGKVEDLARVARAQFVDEIFVTIPSEREIVKKIAVEARRQRLNLKLVPELYDGLAWKVPINHLGDFPVMDIHWEPIPIVGLFFKRLLDITVSALSLIALSPLLLLLAAAIKLDSAGPALYKSKRVGKKGRTFICYKFRTMVPNAEGLKEQLDHLNERSNGLLFKIKNDPRVTRLGRVLRQYSIDELPQLWNVLKGEMSLVGPRPPLPTEFDQYSLEHLRRLDAKPGITGLWQVSARSDPSFENYLKLDLEYIEKWGFWMDAQILCKTIPVVLEGQGR